VDAATRIAELRRAIAEDDHRYYVLDDPAVSDAEYDARFSELLKLEAEHPELQSTDSPTQRVGGRPSAEFAAVRHRQPMLSLRTAEDETARRDFDRRVRARRSTTQPSPSSTVWPSRCCTKTAC
jgi:DNA ligase (NAD+)